MQRFKALLANQKRSWVLPVAILGMAILIFLRLVNGNSDNSKQQPVEKSWRVNTLSAQLGDHTPNLILHGITESPRHATLESTVNADVMTVNVDEGDRVKKNDILILLDDRETQLLVRQRQAEVNDLKAQIKTEFNRVKTDKAVLKHERKLLALSEKDLGRQQTLFKKRVGSQSAIDNTVKSVQQQSLAVTTREQSILDHENRLSQIKSRLARAQALLEKAELDLERTKIKAPFTGRITKLMVAPGSRMQVGEALIEVYDTENVEIRAQIPSQYIATAQRALDDNIFLKAYGYLDGNRIDMQLDRLAGEVERGRGGVDGLFVLLNKEGHWALGRSFELLLSLPKLENTYKIPTGALYGANRIYIVKNNRMARVTVTRAGLSQQLSGDSHVLIKSAKLKEGDQIITTQLPNARTGLKVTVIKP